MRTVWIVRACACLRECVVRACVRACVRDTRTVIITTFIYVYSRPGFGRVKNKILLLLYFRNSKLKILHKTKSTKSSIRFIIICAKQSIARVLL